MHSFTGSIFGAISSSNQSESTISLNMQNVSTNCPGYFSPNHATGKECISQELIGQIFKHDMRAQPPNEPEENILPKIEQYFKDL